VLPAVSLPAEPCEPGVDVRIKQLSAPADVTHRLREMGFCEEQKIKLLSRQTSLICQVCNARLGISKRLAEKIMVEQIPAKRSPDMSAQSLTPDLLQVGGGGTVSEINLPPEHRGRLLEMGLSSAPLQLVRFAPLGDPVEIKVRGYHLTLRRHDAEQILLQPQ
jgi:ferrous iron transport protein A